MKKLIPLVCCMLLLVTGCSILNGTGGNRPMSDAEMATRVAELLATMTTPTTQMDFPPTPTVSLPTIAPSQSLLPTITPVVVMSQEPTTEFTPTPAETATPEATVTATATATAPASDPANRLGAPTGVDDMNSYDQWAWPTGSDQYLSVEFRDGFLKMTGLTNLAGWRLPLVAQQTNTYIEMTANSGNCSDKDSYGIIFRVPVFKDPVQGYLFEVTCDGYYRLWKWDGKVKPNGLATSLITWKQSTDIIAGSDKTNRLGVMTVDNRIILYANGVKLGEVNDSSYEAGFFGVFVRSGKSSNYTVNIDQMRFWENPTP